mmetsp:Transcript_49254/g.130456  ORF Transcript_49254/g.130456 Transcript_49254/m.130456 type:complete len:180 (+) Transcript_49254:311-850(+)
MKRVPKSPPCSSDQRGNVVSSIETDAQSQAVRSPIQHVVQDSSTQMHHHKKDPAKRINFQKGKSLPKTSLCNTLPSDTNERICNGGIFIHVRGTHLEIEGECAAHDPLVAGDSDISARIVAVATPDDVGAVHPSYVCLVVNVGSEVERCIVEILEVPEFHEVVVRSRGVKSAPPGPPSR